MLYIKAPISHSEDLTWMAPLYHSQPQVPEQSDQRRDKILIQKHTLKCQWAMKRTPQTTVSDTWSNQLMAILNLKSNAGLNHANPTWIIEAFLNYYYDYHLNPYTIGVMITSTLAITYPMQFPQKNHQKHRRVHFLMLF
jgi:hypothetical protein